MRQKTGFISAIIEQELKGGLDAIRKRDGVKLVWLLENAIRDYLQKEKILADGKPTTKK